MMGFKKLVFGKGYGYGKLFVKTNSTSAKWKMPRLLTTYEEAKLTIVDNINNNIIYTGVAKWYPILSIDLSLTSGDCSVYLDVDDFGNGYYNFNAWDFRNITYINFDVIPLLRTIVMYTYGSTIISGNLLNLEYFKSYSNNYIGLDFSQTTKMTLFYHYGNVTFDIDVDLTNNPNLKTYYSGFFPSFNVSNHRNIELLQTRFDDAILDSNINNDYLPNLRYLYIASSNYKDYDFNIRNLSFITDLTLNVNDVIGWNNLLNLKKLAVKTIKSGNSLSGINTIPNLDKLSLNDMRNTTIIDLDNLSINSLVINNSNQLSILNLALLLNLTSFWLTRNTGITEIQIDNGLNAQITKFEMKYNFGNIDVKVDDPVAANNGDAPYLSTIWKEYLDYDSWNFI